MKLRIWKFETIQVFFRCGLKPKSMLQQWRFHLRKISRKQKDVIYFEKKVSPFSTITQVTGALERNCENIKLRENRGEELVSLTTIGYAIKEFSVPRDLLEAILDLTPFFRAIERES